MKSKLFALICLLVIAAITGISAQAATRVAVIVAAFDTSPPPAEGTFQFIQSQLATVDSFYDKVPLASDVHGIYTIPYTQDVTAADTEAYQAAVADGVDLPAGTKLYYIIDGGPPGPVNYTSFAVQWASVAHEFRHHVLTPGYLAHEHGVVCDPSTGACTETESGNRFSVMGLGTGYFSAALQAQFGWVPSIPEITRSGDYCIEPLETPSAGGVKALRWHGGVGDTWPFALEYRQPISFDATSPYDPQVYNGVLVYRLSSNGSGVDTTLLQAAPYAAGTIQDPALHVGQASCDAQGRVSITVLSASPTQACVRFKFGGKC